MAMTHGAGALLGLGFALVAGPAAAGMLDDAIAKGRFSFGGVNIEELRIGRLSLATPGLQSVPVVGISARVREDGKALSIKGAIGDKGELGTLEAEVTPVPEKPTPALSLDLRSDRLTSEQILALWPSVVADGARDWVSAHLSQGTATGLRVTVDAPPDAELGLAIAAKVQDVALSRIADRFDVTSAAGDLKIDRDRLEFVGGGTLNGVSLDTAKATIGFGGAAPLTISATAPAAPISALPDLGAPDLRRFASGELAVTAKLEGTLDEPGTLTLDADLAKAALILPGAGVLKPAGARGDLALVMSLDNIEDGLRINEIVVDSEHVVADASLTLTAGNDGLAQLAVTRLDLPGVAGEASVTRREDGVLAIDVKLTRLAVPTLLDLPEPPAKAADGAAGAEDADGEPGETDKPTRFTATVAIDELVLAAEAFHGVRGTVTGSSGGIEAADIEADLPKESRFTIRVEPDRPNPVIRARSNDAGDLLDALIPDSDFASGGTFRLEADLVRQLPAPVLDGKLAIRNYTVEQAPTLSRLLQVASLTGILNVLTGQGIYFERARTNFHYEDGVVALRDGRAHGSEIGISLQGSVNIGADRIDLEGTLAPAYTINRILAKVPIVGRLLSGKEGAGAFVVTYGIKGPLSDPSFSVNPLSLAVPGALRDLINNIPEDWEARQDGAGPAN